MLLTTQDVCKGASGCISHEHCSVVVSNDSYSQQACSDCELILHVLNTGLHGRI